MSRSERLFGGMLASGLLAAGALVVTSGMAMAQKGSPAPKPRIDCSKAENQKKAACRNQHKELGDEDLFYAGYWLARKGDYALALHYLRQAENKADPRFLTYIGFATRKLGRIDEAMGYYARALEASPDYTVARAYLGEAYLERGERAKAAEQLVEIEQRCGTACDEYHELAQALAKSAPRG